MKILNYGSLKLIMIAVACSFAAGTSLQAREARSHYASARSDEPARLIVARVAGYGTYNHLNLFVDGVYVADLGYLRSYDALLSPGLHVLSVTPEVSYCTHTIVNAEPGQTYAFTARWINNYQVRLDRGDGASRQIVALAMPPATPTGSCGR
jgi:hypothetical protein